MSRLRASACEVGEGIDAGLYACAQDGGDSIAVAGRGKWEDEDPRRPVIDCYLI